MTYFQKHGTDELKLYRKLSNRMLMDTITNKDKCIHGF